MFWVLLSEQVALNLSIIIFGNQIQLAFLSWLTLHLIISKSSACFTNVIIFNNIELIFVSKV